MKAEQYLPGDTVLYVTSYFKGQTREVAQSTGERVCFTSGGCGHPENFTLIKRYGRDVKSVIVNPRGGARIEFQDSTIQWWVVYDERWAVSYGVLTNEQFQTVHKDWTYEYQAPETPEPSNVRALNLDSALAEIKRRHQFCSEFDTQVSRAKAIAGSDGDTQAALELVAKEQGRPELIQELRDLLKPRTLKWKKGDLVVNAAILKNSPVFMVRTVAEDVYVDDTRFSIKGWTSTYPVAEYIRIESKEV